MEREVAVVAGDTRLAPLLPIGALRALAGMVNVLLLQARGGLGTVPSEPDSRRSEIAVGDDDKTRNKVEELRGKAKEKVGRATDDPALEEQGRRDQTTSNLKQAGEKVKDAFKR
jgi:uncharacterized protein YjbJ (UPF0337 family)